MKKILMIIAILMTNSSAKAQNFFSPMAVDNMNTASSDQSKAEDIFELVKQNDAIKISAHLKLFPESISLQKDGWYPAQYAVWFKKAAAAKIIIAYLKENDMLDQLHERKSEGQDEGSEGSAYDLGGQFIDQILAELAKKN